MTSKRFLITCTTLLGFAYSIGNAAAAVPAPPKPDETRAYLEQWVEFRKTISEEENEWLSDKETITRSISLIRSEMERLERDITSAKENSTEAERRRVELNAENDAQKASARAVSDKLGALENRIKEQIEYFPEPLKNQVEPLKQRIPPPAAAARLGGGARLQNIVGIMQLAEKFNQSISVASGIEELPSGENAQVDTIYLGLGIAYFVDGTGQYAGIMTPAPGEWTKEQNDAIASEVKTLVEVFRKDVLAEFVTLPVTVK